MSKKRRRNRKRKRIPLPTKIQLETPAKKRKKRKLNRSERKSNEKQFQSPKPRRRSSSSRNRRKSDDFIAPKIQQPPSVRRERSSSRHRESPSKPKEGSGSENSSTPSSGREKKKKRRFKLKDKKNLLSHIKKKKKRKKTVFRGGEKNVDDLSLDWSLKERATIVTSNEQFISALFRNPTFVDSSSRNNYVHNTNMGPKNDGNNISQFQKGNHVIDSRSHTVSRSYNFSEHFRRSLYYYVFQTINRMGNGYNESDHESDGNDADGTKLPLFRKRSQFKSLKNLQRDNWSESFFSIYLDFSNGQVPYFYCRWMPDGFHEAYCLYVAAGVNGEENSVRVILYTKTQFAKMQKMFESHGVELEAVVQKGYMIVSERSNVQSFTNIFHKMVAKLHGCSIYSPCQFLNSTLKRNHFRMSQKSSTIGRGNNNNNNNNNNEEESRQRKKKTKINDQKSYVVKVEGILLPHNVQILGNALKSMGENFGCSFRVHLNTKESTNFFNALFCYKAPIGPTPLTPLTPTPRTVVDLKPGYFIFSQLNFGGDFQYLDVEEDIDMKGRILEGFSVPSGTRCFNVRISRNTYK